MLRHLVSAFNGESGKPKDASIAKNGKTPGHRHRFPVFIFLCSITISGMMVIPCPDIGTAYAQPRISIASNHEPLHDLLAKISGSTGYQIEITKGWKDKFVTADLKQVTLEESLQTIMRAMGSPSYAMILDKRMKKVEIRIFDASATGRKQAGDRDIVTGNDFPDKKNRSTDFDPGTDRQKYFIDAEKNAPHPQRPDLGIELPY